MKITKRQLRKLIKEELKVLTEAPWPSVGASHGLSGSIKTKAELELFRGIKGDSDRAFVWGQLESMDDQSRKDCVLNKLSALKTGGDIRKACTQFKSPFKSHPGKD